MSAGQLADMEQVPVPVIICTVALFVPPPVQALAGPEVMVAEVLALVVAVTVNVPQNTSMDGAPVKVTVGVAFVAPVY